MQKTLDQIVVSEDSEWCYVAQSDIDKKGLFAAKNIPKETKVIEYKGERITVDEGRRRLQKQKEEGHVCLFKVEEDDDPNRNGFWIDGAVNGSDASYANHSCEPNCQIEISDGHIWLVASKDIKAKEELSFDYCLDSEMAMLCNCNSKKCRGYIVDESELPRLAEILRKEVQKMAEGTLRGLNFRLSNMLNSAMLVKLIDPSDINALVWLDEECFEDLYYDAGEFAEEIGILSSYGVIAYRLYEPIALNKKRPIGYIIGHRDRVMKGVPPPPSEFAMPEGSYLISCAVHPVFQNIGVFRSLLKSFEELSIEQERCYIRLHARTHDNPENNGACDVFLRSGFKTTRTTNDYYEKGDHVYEMVKRLGQ